MQREGTISSVGKAGLQVLFEVNGERKLITSVAAGRKFKRNCVFAPCPHISKSENSSAFGNWLLVKRLSLESKNVY